MKKIFAILLACLFVFSCVAVAEEKPTLIMETNAAFPPYEYHDTVDGEDAIVGIDAEIFYALCEYMGYEGEIVDTDFNAIIADVISGKCDVGMAGMTVTEERLQTVNFSASYATGIQVVIVKEGSEITSIDDLSVEGKNYLIGVQEATTGDLYSTWDLEDKGLATVERFKVGADAVNALVTGKVDCVIIDNEPAKAFVAANEGLTILDSAYAIEDYAIAVSKDNEELLTKIDEALVALTEDGTIPAIIAKYIPVEESAEEDA